MNDKKFVPKRGKAKWSKDSNEIQSKIGKPKVAKNDIFVQEAK